MTNMWELRYFIGGRELQKSIGDQFVVGENFAFLGQDWGKTPMIASILETAGVTEVPSRIYPLIGDEEISVPGGQLRQRSIPPQSLCSIWTDQSLYREGRDPVKIFIFSASHAGQALELSIWCDGKELDAQPVAIDQHGICSLELPDLPAGRYRLSLDGDRASTTFNIAQARVRTLEGEWIQCYARPIDHQRNTMVFVIQLSSLGCAVQDEFQIQLIDEGRPHLPPLSRMECRSDGGGRIAGDLLLSGIGPFSVEIQSYTDPTKWCLLSVPLIEESKLPDTEPQTISSLGDHYTWRWEGGDGPLGLKVERTETRSSSPLLLESLLAQEAIFSSQCDWSELLATVINPVAGTHETHHWQEVNQGQQLQFEAPYPFGLVAFGGFKDGQPWEGWSLVMPPPPLQLQLSVSRRHQPTDPLQVTLRSNAPSELPVYLLVREILDEEIDQPWGPAQALETLTSELTETLKVGIPEEMLWAVANQGPAARPSVPPPKQPPPRPQLAPPKMPHPSAGGAPKAKEAPPEPAKPQRLPPQEEDFPQTLYSAILPLSDLRTVDIPAPPEDGEYRIEALALTGYYWAYAYTDSFLERDAFCELLVPPHAHENDSVIGEAIVETEESHVLVSLWRNQEPVTLYREEVPISSQEPLEGPLLQLKFTLAPGHYVLQVGSLQGEVLDTIEAEVSPWGQNMVEGWGLQLLPAPQAWSSHKENAYWANHHSHLLPNLDDKIRTIAKELIERGSGHCEQEAARLAAVICSLGYVENFHQEALLETQLQQILDRLFDMFVPHRGFRLYPDQGHDPKWGEEALYHIWDLLWMHSFSLYQPHNPEQAHSWYSAIQQISEQAATAYHLSLTPTRIQSARDAYRVFLFDPTPARKEEAIWEIEKRLVENEYGPFINHENIVKQRQDTCYAALPMLASENPDHKVLGLRLANWALREWHVKDESYSTSEGVALLTLLHFLQQSVLSQHSAVCSLDGLPHEQEEQTKPLPFDDVHVLEGVAPVALTYPRLPVDLSQFDRPIPWEVRLAYPDKPQVAINEAELGDRLHLSIRLDVPCEVGDILELYLPPSLAWIDGERHEKHFVIGIFPHQEFVLPLITIETTTALNKQVGIQHWGVRLSNTYQSHRGNAFFNQSIIVWEPGQRKRDNQDAWIGRWQKIFGS